ncbi:MAG: SusC/RagA family TonB-linked outer membrane protein [Bacteroidetes bacterium]|nr:SusC/RagA family TonB-linked outer membrane protein [Bacteroidota bacterium]
MQFTNACHFLHQKQKIFAKTLLIMKLTAILLVAFCLQVKADAYGQKTISISVKNESLKKVFKEIKLQSGYVFFYDYKLLANAKPVTIDFKDKTIEDALGQCLKGQSIDYGIVGKTIILKQKQGEAQNTETLLDAAINEVKGKVTDEKGEPLVGASVTVKGTNKGTTADAQGEFKIQANKGDVLVVSFLGYNSSEIIVTSQTNIKVSLQPHIKEADQVVVVGYGTTTRKNLTTAIAKIDPKVIPQAANNSLAQLLFGRAAGLQAVQQSAEPGGNISLSIRGRGAPLIVVDGVVMPYDGLEPDNGTIGVNLNGVHRGGFEGINPDDIESIEVLKDASAAIYGVNAANGVILITTKKGKSGKMNLSYDGSYSMSRNMKYLQPLTASNYMNYFDQLSLDKYLIDNKMAPFGPNAASGFVPKYSQQDIGNAGVGTNWLDQVLRDGSITNHTLAASGGSDKVVYYLSGNYFDQVGTVKNSGLQKYSGRMNISASPSKFITLNGSLIAARNNFLNSTAGWQTGGSGSQGFGALQAALAYPSSVPVRDSSGKYTLFNITGNPVSMLDIQDQTQYSSLFATGSVDLNFIPGVLTGHVLYGNNSENSTRSFFIPSTTFYFQQFRARGSWTEAYRQNQTMEATMTFKKRFWGNKLNMDAVAGMGQYIYNDYGFTAQGADMKDAIGVTALQTATGTSVGISSFQDYNKTRSYFARGSFDILDKYVLSLTYRYDGSSNFFPQSKYAGFPSASVAWKLSNEPFLQKIKSINLLKIRGSIGITGLTNGALAYGAFRPDVSIITFNDGSAQHVAYYLSSLDQPNLTWPKTVNKNIGLDFSLLKDRVSGSIDFFHDDFTRILTSDNTAPLSFIPTHLINAGHQVRKGYEVNINTVNIKSANGFEWNTILNVSHVDFYWQQRFPNADLPSYAKVNDPVNSIYVYKTSGILQVGQTAPSWQPVNAQMPGAPIFVDVNGDKKLDSADVVRYNYDPKISIGLGNTFRYKNIDLTIFLYGQFGGYNYNYLTLWSDPASFIAGTQSGIEQIKSVWTTTNTKGTLPGVAYNESALGLLTGVDTRVQSTNFVRCRNITLGYTLNPKAFKMLFKSLRLYFDAQNPFIVTNYKIADPEVQAVNVKGGPAPYPMTRIFSFGINAHF